MQEQEPWGAVEDVARQLGSAEDTVYRWIEQKALQACRGGRLWRFKLTQTDAWIEAGGAAEPDTDDAKERE